MCAYYPSIEIKSIRPNCKFPTKATELSAGFDLYACLDESVVIRPGERMLIPLGFCMDLGAGYEAQIRPRSGLALKYGITVLNSPGTIDADYRGEVKVILINLGKDSYLVESGSRIAQIVFSRLSNVDLNIVEELDNNTNRGTGGFGSTGL